jgi:glycine cleavage system aminomethyltransferase T
MTLSAAEAERAEWSERRGNYVARSWTRSAGGTSYDTGTLLVQIRAGSKESDTLVATSGWDAEVELEYAAIRSGCALVDCPERGTVVVRGKDRAEFVNRLVTNEVQKLGDGAVTRAFLTNRKGRIDADLVIASAGDALVIDTLVHDVDAVRDSVAPIGFARARWGIV